MVYKYAQKSMFRFLDINKIYFLVFCCFETGFHYVAQAGLKLKTVLQTHFLSYVEAKIKFKNKIA
jgi:hypothetical protein